MMNQYKHLLRGPCFSLVVLLAALILLARPGLGSLAWAGPAEGALDVAAQAGRLSLKVSDVPLDKVLGEISRQTQIRIYGQSHINRDKKIQEEFLDLPIEAAFERLLNGYNYAFQYSGQTDRFSSLKPSLKEVWLFSRGEGQVSEANGMERTIASPSFPGEPTHGSNPIFRQDVMETAPESTDQPILTGLLAALKHPDQTVRLGAIDALSQLGSKVSGDPLEQIGLNHEDPQTRRAILASTLPLSEKALVEHALHDSDPSVRIEALMRVFQDQLGAEAVGNEALKDPDPSVQAMARQILEMKESEFNPPPIEQAPIVNVPDEMIHEWPGDEGQPPPDFPFPVIP